MKKLFLLAFILLTNISLFSQIFPSPTGYVNDWANVISPEHKSQLEQKLSQYEKQTSIELTVVTCNDLQGCDRNSFATALGNAWGVGKKGVNDGAVIFLSLDPNDRGIYIATGYGLEEFLTDATSSKLCRDNLSFFKKGDYSSGMVALTNGVMNALGNATKEMREMYVKQLKKERQERINSFLNFLLTSIIVLSVFAIIIFIGITIVKKNKEQKKLQKQFNDLKSKINDHPDPKVVFESEIRYIQELSRFKFANAPSAEKAMGNYIRLYESIISENDNITKVTKENISKLEAIYDKLQVVHKGVKDLYTQLKYDKSVLDEATKLELSKDSFILNYENTENNIRDLKSKLEDKLGSLLGIPDINESYKTFATVDDLKNEFDSLTTAISENNFSKIHSIADNIINKSNNLNLKYNFYKSKLSEITDFISTYDINKIINEVKAKVSEVESYVNKSHVSSSTISDLSSLKKKIDTTLQQLPTRNDVCLNWFLVINLINDIFTSLNGIINSADNDISNYKKKIAEQEEEEERHRRDSYSSYSSNSYSSYSTNSFGGGFSGFGGGSFGGGGGGASF
jgi:uncharacterized membrane protein YgcG